MRIEPRIFAKNVASGKFKASILAVTMEIAYLQSEPIAPPKATASIFSIYPFVARLCPRRGLIHGFVFILGNIIATCSQEEG